MKSSAFDITKNMENNCIMRRARSIHILAHNMNRMRYIRLSNSEINQIIHQLSVKGVIFKWNPVKGCAFGIRL